MLRQSGKAFRRRACCTPATTRRSFCSQSKSSHFSSSEANKSAGPRNLIKYMFEIRAACRGKNSKSDASNSVPHPESCGEDSFFAAENVFGIADGVGGWNNNNVDPSRISRRLMFHAKELASSSHQQMTTYRLLTDAYQRVLEDDTVDAGSTTACILQLKYTDEQLPVLEYTNLGDSGFVVIRKNKIIFKSKFQSIGPAPYQLAKIPPRFREYGAIESQPSESDSGEIDLEEGDIIVLATDGVWDNFAPNLKETPAFFPPVRSWERYSHGKIDSLVNVINCGSKENAGVESNLQKTAINIVNASLRHNLKPDDITVLIAEVKRDNS